MKLRNKKTGEIIETDYELSVSIPDDEKFYGCNTHNQIKGYSSLTELNEEWEDYEEPKEYWYLESDGDIDKYSCDGGDYDKRMKAIGNYFETREEAEKAVEKLKAFKRLKDNGMRKYSFRKEKRGIDLDFYTLTILAPRDKDSLDLLFCTEVKMTEKEDWEKMQAGEWHCACCDTYLEPIDSTHVICPKCGLKHRFKDGKIQTKGNMMEDYDE